MLKTNEHKEGEPEKKEFLGRKKTRFSRERKEKTEGKRKRSVRFGERC